MAKPPRVAIPSVINKIRKDRDFSTLIRMVNGMSTRHMIVGGKVYRGLIEEMYGVNASYDKADWDFLCWDCTTSPIEFDGWTRMRGPGISHSQINQISAASPYSPYSYSRRGKIPTIIPDNRRSCRYIRQSDSLMVDFISMEDIEVQMGLSPSSGTYKDYWKVVPLDIQSISLDLKDDWIYGPGIKCIEDRTVKIQNETALANAGHNPIDYVSDKIMSFGQVKFNLLVEAIKGHKCHCPSRDLFTYGCRCGGI